MVSVAFTKPSVQPMSVGIGSPWPLGSSVCGDGVNFSVAAPDATQVELLLFEHSEATTPSHVIPLPPERHRSGDYWHAHVAGVGIGCCYGYRVWGPVSSAGKGFHPNKVLLDPCARAIGGWQGYQRAKATGDGDNTEHCLKAIVTERERFDLQRHPRPRHSWRHTSMFCSNAGAYPLPSSLSRVFTPEIHRTNALRSREWSLPRLSS